MKWWTPCASITFLHSPAASFGVAGNFHLALLKTTVFAAAVLGVCGNRRGIGVTRCKARKDEQSQQSFQSCRARLAEHCGIRPILRRRHGGGPEDLCRARLLRRGGHHRVNCTEYARRARGAEYTECDSSRAA